MKTIVEMNIHCLARCTLLLLGGFFLQARAAEGVEADAIKVLASSWETKAHGGVGDFPPELTIDGKISIESSWRSEGPGSWIQWSFGKGVNLRSVGLAFLFGDKRNYTFDILVTDDPAGTRDWKLVHRKQRSGGTTLELEWFDVNAPRTWHVRLIGYGNNSEKFPRWTNLTEVSFAEE